MRKASNDSSLLILPGDPRYYATLSMSLPIGWENSGFLDFINDPDSGLIVPIKESDLRDYLHDYEDEGE